MNKYNGLSLDRYSQKAFGNNGKRYFFYLNSRKKDYGSVVSCCLYQNFSNYNDRQYLRLFSDIKQNKLENKIPNLISFISVASQQSLELCVLMPNKDNH